MSSPTSSPAGHLHPSTFPTLVVLVCLWSLLGGLVPAGAQQADDELRAELERVEAEQARLSTSLQESTARVDDLTARIAQIQDRAAELRGELGALSRREGRAARLVQARIRTLYKGDRVSDVMAFATGTSLNQMSRRTHYLTALTRNDQRHYEAASALIAATRARRAELATVDRRLGQLVAEAAQAQTELDAQLAAAGAAHQGISDELARREEARRRAAEAQARAAAEARARAAAEAAQERRRQVALAQEAQAAERRAAAASRSADRTAAAAAAPAPAPAPAPPPSPAPAPDTSSGGSGGSGGSGSGSTGGGKVCPQDNPRAFTDTWGAPRSGGRTHQGTDIFGARGGDVFAIVSGRVEWTQTGSLSGLLLSLRGDDGHRYWYMHLQDFVARAGQRVRAGQLIAHNGDTGNARGSTPHIHFEYHPGGGAPVNPYPMLKAICG